MRKTKITIAVITITFLTLIAIVPFMRGKPASYKDISHPTPNTSSGINLVQGVVLHHTACSTINSALNVLCSPKSGVSCHVLIDRDGTRYILAAPDKITHHAGYSMLNGKDGCNRFTIGIEFQGNTCTQPLTNDQIKSAILYLLPIIKQNKIPLKNIVTHEQVRNNWLKAHPDLHNVPAKCDITPTEYNRFITALESRL